MGYAVNILIVEDDLSLQKLYEMILKAYGYNVIEKANNGQEAVKLYKMFSANLDIFLMDIELP